MWDRQGLRARSTRVTFQAIVGMYTLLCDIELTEDITKERQRCVDTLEIIHLGRISWLASERCRRDLSAPPATEARVRTSRSNCKSLRILRCSPHCRRRCARGGRHSEQLHQTRVTQVFHRNTCKGISTRL